MIGLTAGIACGITAGSIIKVAGDAIREDDTVILSRLFNGVILNMISEYMLSESEQNLLIEKLNNINAKEFKTLCKNINSSNNQEEIIENFVKCYFQEIIRKRPKIAAPTPKDLIDLVNELDYKAS